MAIVNPTMGGVIAVTEGSGESMVILIVLTIVIGAAAYFTGRLYGKVGLYAIAAAYVVMVVTLMALGGLRFS